MALRGPGNRDSRQFISDLDNLGVERGESVSVNHTSFGGATLSQEPLAGAGNLCRSAAPAAFAGRSARSGPGRGACKSCGASRTSRRKR